MKVRAVAIVTLVLIIAAGITVYAWNARPRLIEVYPQAGAANISALTPIRLVFSRAMRQETVSPKLKFEPSIEGSYSWNENILTFTPSEPWPEGKMINVQLEAGARATTWLAFPLNGQSWSFKTSEGTIAYLWPSDGPADLYALDPVMGDIRQFTHGMGVLDYSVSNDGMTVYFSASNSKGGTDLYRLELAKAESSPGKTTIAQELLNCGAAQCRNPVMSFDSRYLAYEYILPNPSGSLGPAQIWLLSITALKATPIGQTSHETVQPTWSSTGLLAYYDRTISGYEVVNPITQERVELPNQTGQPGAWSHDGGYYLAPEIYYSQASGNYETGSSHLLRYSIQSKSFEDLSGADEVEDVEGTYSPDGNLIVFARKFLDTTRWSLGRQIWVMNADGSNPHPITNEADYNHYDFALSQDGSRLAYVRFNKAKLSDPPELWIVNIDGSSPVQLVIGGYSPIWIP